VEFEVVLRFCGEKGTLRANPNKKKGGEKERDGNISYIYTQREKTEKMKKH